MKYDDITEEVKQIMFETIYDFGKTLQNMKMRGMIYDFKIDGSNVYIMPIKTVEHINFTFELKDDKIIDFRRELDKILSF
jgi:hypothetical protein